MSPRALLAFCDSLPSVSMLLSIHFPESARYREEAGSAIPPLAWVKGVYTRSANRDTVLSPHGDHQGLNSTLPSTAVPPWPTLALGSTLCLTTLFQAIPPTLVVQMNGIHSQAEPWRTWRCMGTGRGCPVKCAAALHNCSEH